MDSVCLKWRGGVLQYCILPKPFVHPPPPPRLPYPNADKGFCCIEPDTHFTTWADAQKKYPPMMK
jgi:hypothetical protein